MATEQGQHERHSIRETTRNTHTMLLGSLNHETGHVRWRKLVGVEPTCAARATHTGFEDQARHRPNPASALAANGWYQREACDACWAQ